MKPLPTSNFSIWAYPASLNEEGSPPELFEGSYGVLLNNTVTVTFVPEYARAADGWPVIDVPEGYDGPTKIPEARAWVALSARYVVTPADAVAPSRVIVHGEDEQSQFFVTEADYTALAAELEWIAGNVPRIGRRLSDLPATRLVRLLVDDIVPSTAFAASDRYWLTAPSS